MWYFSCNLTTAPRTWADILSRVQLWYRHYISSTLWQIVQGQVQVCWTQVVGQRSPPIFTRPTPQKYPTWGLQNPAGVLQAPTDGSKIVNRKPLVVLAALYAMPVLANANWMMGCVFPLASVIHCPMTDVFVEPVPEIIILTPKHDLSRGKEKWKARNQHVSAISLLM